MPTYTDESLTVEPKQVAGIGNTFEPLRGADWWECPFCRGKWTGCYTALRAHLGGEHNLRVVDQALELRVGVMFDGNDQVVRYEPNVGGVAVDAYGDGAPSRINPSSTRKGVR